MIVKIPFSTPILIFLALQTGCTTLRSSKQRIKVVTEPPGAEVYYEGKNLGRTPAFMEVKRAKSAELELEKSGFTSKRVQLPTSYRWRDSFFSNLIWLNWAYVGWVTDLISGTAWEYESEGPVSLEASATKPKSVPSVAEPSARMKIAIAPPQTEHEILSDELGEKLEAWAQKRFPNAEVIPYSTSQVTFADFAYIHDNLVNPKFRDELSYRLGATHILESQADEVENGKVLVSAKIQDVFTGKTFAQEESHFAAGDIRYQKQGQFKRSILKYITFLPNTITFDTTTATADIRAGAPDGLAAHAPYHSVSNKPPTLWSTIAGVGIRNLRGPELYQPLSLELRFVPTLSIYSDQFRFDAVGIPNEFDGATFRWYTFQVGYGPELNLLSPIGILYYDLIPAIGWDWIYTSRGGVEKSMTKSMLHFENEVGFSFFLSRNINVRLYGRWVSTGSELWSQVLSESAGRRIDAQTSNQLMGGFSFGYYFPEARTGIKRFFRQ